MCLKKRVHRLLLFYVQCGRNDLKCSILVFLCLTPTINLSCLSSHAQCVCALIMEHTDEMRSDHSIWWEAMGALNVQLYSMFQYAFQQLLLKRRDIFIKSLKILACIWVWSTCCYFASENLCIDFREIIWRCFYYIMFSEKFHHVFIAKKIWMLS